MKKKQDDIKPLNTFDEILSILPGRNSDKPDQSVVVYTRLSQIDLNKPQYSLEIQPDQVEGYAKSKGLKIIRTYCDQDYSGKNSDRPDLKNLIDDVIAGRVKTIIVHRLDRIYRNLESLLYFLRFLEKYDVQLISVSEDINTSEVWGRLLIYILGAFAELWVRQTSERLREMKTIRARQGLTNASFVFGYCNGRCSNCTDPNGVGYCPCYGEPDRPKNVEDRVLVPHPIESKAVQLITRMYAEGNSYREITHYLNTNTFELTDGLVVKFRTKGNPGRFGPGEFNADSVRQIVSNPYYAGYVVRYPTPPLDMTDELLHRIGGIDGQ